MSRTWKEFDLSQISISDEAMEDLETFNMKYGNNYPMKDYNENSSSLNELFNESDKPCWLNQSIDKPFFCLEMYLRRILQGKNVTKQNLIKIAKEIISVNDVNIGVMALVKGIKKTASKTELVNTIIKIINIILYTKYSN